MMTQMSELWPMVLLSFALTPNLRRCFHNIVEKLYIGISLKHGNNYKN